MKYDVGEVVSAVVNLTILDTIQSIVFVLKDRTSQVCTALAKQVSSSFSETLHILVV